MRGATSARRSAPLFSGPPPSWGSPRSIPPSRSSRTAPDRRSRLLLSQAVPVHTARRVTAWATRPPPCLTPGPPSFSSARWTRGRSASSAPGWATLAATILVPYWSGQQTNLSRSESAHGVTARRTCSPPTSVRVPGRRCTSSAPGLNSRPSAPPHGSRWWRRGRMLFRGAPVRKAFCRGASGTRSTRWRATFVSSTTSRGSTHHLSRSPQRNVGERFGRLWKRG
mmetsp:Transcript_11784/g.38778  ORF Transcript_11784/g.38778 Transcript_11784/m.38778 type:complete len:225 (+) Transcript_11784:618-1292(+)